MNLKVLIVDNDELDVSDIEENLLKYSALHETNFNIKKFHTFENLILSSIEGYDLVFINTEIDLDNINEFAKAFRKKDNFSVIIFISPTKDFAYNAFNFLPSDLCLKPINYLELERKLNFALKYIKTRNKQHIIINSNGKRKLVEISNIKFIEILSHDLTIHTKYEKIKAKGVLSTYENLLKNRDFSRCSACSLVNLYYVKEINGEYLTLKSGEKIHIGRTRKKEFINDLNSFANNIE